VNHGLLFLLAERTFSALSALHSRFRPDFASSGHTSPFVVPPPARRSGRRRAWSSQAVDQPQDAPEQIAEHGNFRHLEGDIDEHTLRPLRSRRRSCWDRATSSWPASGTENQACSVLAPAPKGVRAVFGPGPGEPRLRGVVEKSAEIVDVVGLVLSVASSCLHAAQSAFSARCPPERPRSPRARNSLAKRFFGLVEGVCAS
jgi:hypothetical protein